VDHFYPNDSLLSGTDDRFMSSVTRP